MALKPADALHIIDIVDENDHLCLVDLCINGSLVLLGRGGVQQHRRGVDRQHVQVARQDHRVVGLRHLPREGLSHYRDDN